MSTRPINETLREAAERQGNENLSFVISNYFLSLARALKRRQILRDATTRKMRELTRRVNFSY